MHVEQLGEIIPPPIHNNVGVCNQVTFLILNYITSRFVPLLKVIDAPIKVPNVLDLTVSFEFLNFSSQISFLFVPEMSANFTPYTVQIIYLALAWVCIHCILARFLWSKKPKYFSSNQGLFCFNTCTVNHTSD